MGAVANCSAITICKSVLNIALATLPSNQQHSRNSNKNILIIDDFWVYNTNCYNLDSLHCFATTSTLMITYLHIGADFMPYIII